jgi:hypothetical protein
VKAGAERVVYANYLIASATAIYTFEGQGAAFSRILRMRFTNTDSVMRTVTVLIVPAGGTITDVRYAELAAVNLAPQGADRSILEYEPSSESAGLKLRNGESIVAWSNVDNRIAARVEVEEVT